MKPTIEQITELARAASFQTMEPGKIHREAYTAQVIEAWEAIRPKEDSQLARTNHALAEELATVKERVLGLEHQNRLHSQSWESARPFMEFMQGGGFGLAGECCFQVGIRTIENLQRELATTTELLESSRKQEEGTSAIVQSLRDRNASLERSSQALLASKDEKEKMVNSCLEIIAELKQRIKSAERGGISDVSFIAAIERGEFEAWAFDRMGLRRNGDKYYLETTESAWTAWKAARAK